MKDDPLRPYCPLCEKDYALDAFADHTSFPRHLAADAWAKRAAVEHLSHIHTLLQKLVDNSKQHDTFPTPRIWSKCAPCVATFFSQEEEDAHRNTPAHTTNLAAWLQKS